MFFECTLDRSGSQVLLPERPALAPAPIICLSSVFSQHVCSRAAQMHFIAYQVFFNAPLSLPDRSRRLPKPSDQ